MSEPPAQPVPVLNAAVAPEVEDTVEATLTMTVIAELEKFAAVRPMLPVV
jgi:hypothetical protein